MKLLFALLSTWCMFAPTIGLAQANTNTNALVVLSATTRAQVEAAISSIESKGVRVRHVFAPEILLCYIPDANDSYILQSSYVTKVLRGTVDPTQFVSKISKHAATAFNNLNTSNPAGEVATLVELHSIRSYEWILTQDIQPNSRI